MLSFAALSKYIRHYPVSLALCGFTFYWSEKLAKIAWAPSCSLLDPITQTLVLKPTRQPRFQQATTMIIPSQKRFSFGNYIEDTSLWNPRGASSVWGPVQNDMTLLLPIHWWVLRNVAWTYPYADMSIEFFFPKSRKWSVLDASSSITPARISHLLSILASMTKATFRKGSECGSFNMS